LGFVVRDVGTGKRYAMDRLTVSVIDPQILQDNPEAVRQSQVACGASVQLVDEAIAADQNRRVHIGAAAHLQGQESNPYLRSARIQFHARKLSRIMHD